ncbi:MAG: hypothetical protein JWP59_87 [Massilia sp.]|nr:hypothetical protein [Massilia sp.]
MMVMHRHKRGINQIERVHIMFNATTQTNATQTTSPLSLFAIIEALLLVNLRDELVAETSADQADDAYHYGL